MSKNLENIKIPGLPDYTVFIHRGFEFRAAKDWIRGRYRFRFRRFSKKKRRWFKEWECSADPGIVNQLGIKTFTNCLIDDRIKQTKQT